MLESLHIENIAVIEKTDVDFSSGFTALTGETGAGKSIIIDSINAVLGERTSKELIRNGCDKASVTAIFNSISKEVKSKLSDFGIEVSDESLIIKRTLTDSKSSCKINGQNAPAFVLKEIAPFLINIHGQHDSQTLLNPDMHYIYIDLLAKNEAVLNEYKTAFSAMLKTRKTVKQFENNKQENERKKEILSYQINELEAAGISAGEIEKLKNRREEILNSKKIADSLQIADQSLSGDEEEQPGAYELIEKASQELMKIASFSEEYSSAADKIENLKYELEDLKANVENFIDNAYVDENELETVELRLDTYYSFKSKYGETEEEMLEFLNKAKQELFELENAEETAIEEQLLLPKQIEEVKEKGAALTESRRKAADLFEKGVKKQLEFLDMPNVNIAVDIQKCAYSTLGADKIEFLISTNPGEPLKPLSKIASGGEMSRIMLSIKNVLSDADIVPTLIFDEIDTGISGNAAAKVADRLKAVSKGKQVICVTHLAQIAAKADTQLKIEKNIENDRAVTTVTTLDYEGRKNELARIIGSSITDASLAAAEEMLNN
ncbi:MAG: DNA repair protein RecN [Acutalibacteraceae bacterium]